MRTANDTVNHRAAAATDGQQQGLFIESLDESQAQPVDDVRHADAAARSQRRRPALADREPAPGEPLQVPIDSLQADVLHPREDYPQDCLNDLARDIAERGALQAIVVAPADAQGRYRIRFGVQRWRAARLAGLAQVPVAVRTQPADIYDAVAENIKRHGLAPLDLARFIHGRVEAGESNAHIAQKLAVDPTTVAHHLSLLELPPVLSVALESGRCTSPRTLHELTKVHANQPDAVAALLAGDLPVTRDCHRPDRPIATALRPSRPPADAPGRGRPRTPDRRAVGGIAATARRAAPALGRLTRTARRRKDIRHAELRSRSRDRRPARRR